ncbi:YdcF family protein [Neobacillus sp. SM06]|uniref:YdcF family protein n=1 Tax=Neobacillus sp. SM06 TaxID=3422492 RepID=UPI003D2BDABF
MDYLLKAGIGENKKIIENQAKDTVENLIYCRNIMKGHGIRRSILISNSFHLRRIWYIAKSIGFHVDFYCSRNTKTIFRQTFHTINELRIFMKIFWANKECSIPSKLK